jgi:hypothetical protein
MRYSVLFVATDSGGGVDMTESRRLFGRTIAAFISLSLGMGAIAAATVLHVPAHYPTIQTGIDAAVDGDTVLIADGIYTGDGNRDLDFTGKAIVVTSVNGPEATIIDSEGGTYEYHRAFDFHSGERASSVVNGLGIRGGVYFTYSGAGIRCIESSPTITGCIFRDNTSDNGAAILCEDSSPVIIGNTFIDNYAYSG